MKFDIYTFWGLLGLWIEIVKMEFGKNALIQVCTIIVSTFCQTNIIYLYILLFIYNYIDKQILLLAVWGSLVAFELMFLLDLDISLRLLAKLY